MYRGRAFTGVGTDSWTPDSPANQLIAMDPEAASFSSDNVDALVRFYDSIDSKDGRETFVTALLNRLQNGTYLSVSYFIVAVLWKIGWHAQALQKAKAELPLGDDKEFGLSNVLMLLNGLLKVPAP